MHTHGMENTSRDDLMSVEDMAEALRAADAAGVAGSAINVFHLDSAPRQERPAQTVTRTVEGGNRKARRALLKSLRKRGNGVTRTTNVGDC